MYIITTSTNVTGWAFGCWLHVDLLSEIFLTTEELRLGYFATKNVELTEGGTHMYVESSHDS